MGGVAGPLKYVVRTSVMELAEARLLLFEVAASSVTTRVDVDAFLSAEELIVRLELFFLEGVLALAVVSDTTIEGGKTSSSASRAAAAPSGEAPTVAVGGGTWGNGLTLCESGEVEPVRFTAAAAVAGDWASSSFVMKNV